MNKGPKVADGHKAQAVVDGLCGTHADRGDFKSDSLRARSGPEGRRLLDKCSTWNNVHFLTTSPDSRSFPVSCTLMACKLRGFPVVDYCEGTNALNGGE